MQTQWEKIRIVERMQAHIEGHLGDTMTMADLARVAGYSQWHAARLFKDVTGIAPFDYIRRRRLSAAAEELRTTSRKVVDVALDFVFDSHEGFTRAFARHFGVPPLRYRTAGSAVRPFLPPRLRERYGQRQRGGGVMNDATCLQTVFVQVLERPTRRMAVRRGRAATHYFEYCEEVGCDVWDRLAAIREARGEPLGMWLPEGLRPPETSPYVQGVELPDDFDGDLPEGFEIADLPACTMLVFQGPPFDEREFERAIESLWDVMKSYRPETYGYAWADEDGPRFQLRPEGWRGYIEGRPVRPIR